MSLIRLNTKHESGITTPAFADFSLKTNLLARGGKSVRLHKISFCNYVGPFPSYRNVIQWDVGGANYTVTIDDGDWSGSDLATYLGTQMTANGPGDTYTVTFNANTYKLTFTTSGTAFRFETVTNGAYSPLGITTLDGSTATTVAADRSVRLDGSEYVDIDCDVVNSSNQFSNSIAKNVLARVPLEGGYGAIIHHEPDTPVKLDMSNYDISNLNLRIRLVDDNEYTHELPLHSPVSYEFVIE